MRQLNMLKPARIRHFSLLPLLDAMAVLLSAAAIGASKVLNHIRFLVAVSTTVSRVALGPWAQVWMNEDATVLGKR